MRALAKLRRAQLVETFKLIFVAVAFSPLRRLASIRRLRKRNDLCASRHRTETHQVVDVLRLRNQHFLDIMNEDVLTKRLFQ